VLEHAPIVARRQLRRSLSGAPPTVVAVRLTAGQARRIALAAQGFAEPRPAGGVSARQLRRVVRRLGIIQLDSVNVFCRTHYLPLYSRLGPYPRDVLDALAAHTAGPVRREFFEYWAHEASLVPIELEPLLRWRMGRASQDAWGGMRRVAEANPALLDDVIAMVSSLGPIRAGETGMARPDRAPGQMWNWHDGKIALEYLFWSGRVTAARRINFERLYDLPERVLPASVRAVPTPPVEDAQRELVRIAARAYGVATEADLGDYFRLPRAESKARVAELIAAGELIPVEVAGWRQPAYLWPEARRPRRVSARALLSPFDPLVWFRPRTERLFGFHYRIEIYTPKPQRRYGYYVLPFLLGEQLVARVDLKSDRQAGILRVLGAFAEDGCDPYYVATELAQELWDVARWLGLASVAVVAHGDLARDLAAAVEQLPRDAA
jgi:uncharacterized protein YcaQ